MRFVSVAAIVLAAGASTRLGRPKQTIVLHGETLVQRAVRVAAQAGLSPLIAVVRSHEDFAINQIGAIIAPNPRADEGMSSSIRLGIDLANRLTPVGAVIMTCDQINTRPEHLRALCAAPEHTTGSLYAGRVGVPAYFPAALFEQLLLLKGDAGARELLRGARAIPDEALALDIDTEEDLKHAQKLLFQQ